MQTLMSRTSLLKLCMTVLLIPSWHLVSAQEYRYPGGIVELQIARQSDDIPEVRFGLRSPAIIDAGSHWRILVGVELGTLPGEYVVYIKRAIKGNTAFSEKFQVQQKIYPLKAAQEGVASQITHEGFSDLDFDNSAQPNLPLLYPVDLAGQWSDNFGYLVEQPDDQSMVAQNYLSLTTTAMAPVVAPQNAIVSKIVRHQTGLATIYLDHGRGLYSIISGLQDLSVTTGNGVVAGAVIGKLPANQMNSTISTLFWQCVLNGVYVNPIILTRL